MGAGWVVALVYRFRFVTGFLTVDSGVLGGGSTGGTYASGL
jgi:hypothetical protein